MELSPCEKFFLDDSSDSDDSEVDTMLLTFRQQTLVMALAVKEHEDENRKRRRGSIIGRLCIPRNRHLGNEMLMQDYFADNPTDTPHLFRRRVFGLRVDAATPE
ncbi:DNA-directed RNA polymerase 3, chloroplastic [Hordeum vulgare]|nr:DNA-directed RNA polymerase 3, chloroplastic [Hordeum vulgare]